jgi:hypothetical protein
MLHETGAFSEDVWMAPCGENAADCEPQNEDCSIGPGFPPVPASRNEKRQEWNKNDEE